MDSLLTQPLAEQVAYAYLLGLATALVLLGLWYGIPALFWWWADRHPVATVDDLLADDLEEIELCDICLVELTDDIAAITCDAHRYCGDCDDATNRCTACAFERRLVLTEERA